MKAMLWSLCVVLLVAGSHALIQPAAAGGFPASTNITKAITAEQQLELGNSLLSTAKLQKFSRANAHVYVAKPPPGSSQPVSQPVSQPHVPLERFEIRYNTGSNGLVPETTTRYSGKYDKEAGTPSSSFQKQLEGWQDIDIPKVQVPSMDIKRPEDWPKVEVPKISFPPASAHFGARNDHEYSTSDSGESSSEPEHNDDEPPTSSSPADSSDAESQSCSKTDSSAEAVLRCVNAVRANPKAFTDGYDCSYNSWIEKASYPQRPALIVDDRLTQSATKHAAWMASRKTVSHVGDNGSTVAQRIKAEGYTTYPQAENVAGGQRSAYEVTMDWMCSEGHRNTIINCDYDNVGTGVDADDNGRLYYAQNFGASDKCDNSGCKC